MNLRDNRDGTCNCRPLMGGCFFTDGFDGPCDCKCHKQKKPEQSVELDTDKLKFAATLVALWNKYLENYTEPPSFESFIKYLVEEAAKIMQSNQIT